MIETLWHSIAIIIMWLYFAVMAFGAAILCVAAVVLLSRFIRKHAPRRRSTWSR